MIQVYQHQPSFKQGFARCAGESANPGLWQGLRGVVVPALGPTGVTLHDVSGYDHHGTLTNMDPATDWVVTGSGYALDFEPHNSDRCVIATNSICGGESFPCIVMVAQPHADSANERLSHHANHHHIFTQANGGLSAGYWLDGSYRAASTGEGVVLANQSSVIVVQNNLLTRLTELYVNGQLEGTAANGPNIPMASGDTHYLGNHSDLDRGFNGTISMFLARDGLLTPNEIQQLSADPLAMFRQREISIAGGAAPGGQQMPIVSSKGIHSVLFGGSILAG